MNIFKLLNSQARVVYYIEGLWQTSDGNWYETFNVEVLEETENGIPGFPLEATIISLIILTLIMSKRLKT